MGLESSSIRAEIDRLLRSKALEGSETQRRLLSYLAEKALAGEGDRVKEYTVALEAFGKPPTYDPRHDATVRLQLGRLRQKLTQYYLEEGAGDPVVVHLPKGGFQLHFDEPGVGNGRAHRDFGRIAWRHVALALAVALVLVAGWAASTTSSLLQLRKQARPVLDAWSPELEQIWEPFLNSPRPLLLCMGTPLFARFTSFGFYRDPTSNQWDVMQNSERFRSLEKALGRSDAMPWYTYTGTGEANAAFLLGKLLSARRPEVVLTRSNILSWQQISDDQLVFVGPPKFNAQLDALPATRDIVMEPRGIRNRRPAAGEPEFLEDKFQAGPQFDGETHALVTHMPGLTAGGDLLILAGNASADTFAAAQWLTDPILAKRLAQRLRRPSGKLPRYYQVVLNVKFRNGIPVESSYVYHHVIQ